MIIIFTGDGKGKTTAALGVALRAIGWNKKVAVVQFIKGNKEIGEWKALQNIDNIDIFQYLDDDKLYLSKPEDRHKKTIPIILEEIHRLADSNKYDLIILDEVNNAIDHHLVSVGKILDVLNKYPKLDFILSGRNADPKLIEIADLVTEMRSVKHPFDKGIPAKKGIDY